MRVKQIHLCCHWLARLGIVKVCGDVELEQLAEFTYDVLRSSVLVLPPQLVICFNDLCQFVGQIVLRPVTRTLHMSPTPTKHKDKGSSAD